MAMNASIDYGRRLIPQILDSVAAVEPDRILYSVVPSSHDSHDFRHVSARTFAKAVDKTAWWLHNRIGASTSIQAVGYIGPRKSAGKLSARHCQFSQLTYRMKMTFDTYC